MENIDKKKDPVKKKYFDKFNEEVTYKSKILKCEIQQKGQTK